MDVLAEDYVKIVLEMDTHEEGYVDAYYGPPEWKDEAIKNPRSLTELLSALTRLHSTLRDLNQQQQHHDEGDEVVRLRYVFMEKQVRAPFPIEMRRRNWDLQPHMGLDCGQQHVCEGVAGEKGGKGRSEAAV